MFGVDNEEQGALNKGGKRLEIGYISTRIPLSVYLLFERFPIWLLSIDAAWCRELFLVGCNSLAEFLLLFTTGERELLAILLDPFIKRNKLAFCDQDHVQTSREDKASSLVLISGELFSFVLPKVHQLQDKRVMGVVDSHFGGRLRNGRPTSKETRGSRMLMTLSNTVWLRLRHSATGGATGFMSLFVYTNLVPRPDTTVIQRGIRHVFNASTRPGPPPKLFPEPRLGHYYVLDDRLIPGLYHLPVLCPSNFHSSGTGYRVLSTEELAIAHGFARHLIVAHFPRHLLDYPPCQLLSASLEPIWDNAIVDSAVTNPRPLKRVKETQTWFPSLRKHLSHDWIDFTLVTATASKADDAASPCRLWDSRLELLFGGCTPILDGLRLRLLRRMRRRLLREIRHYLAATFGPRWSTALQLRRQVESKGTSKVHQGGKVNTVVSTVSIDGDTDGKVLGSTSIDGDTDGKVLGSTITDCDLDGKESERNGDTDGKLSGRSNCSRKFSLASEEQIESPLRSSSKRLKLSTSSSYITYLGSEEVILHPGQTTPVIKNLSLQVRDKSAESVSSTTTDFFLSKKFDDLICEVDKVKDVLSKFCWSSWWEWDSGSSLFFWRWGESTRLARDGMVPFIISNLPNNTKRGRSLAKDENIVKITDKLSTIVRKGYIQPGHVKSLIDFFAVPKGSDIRLVYNGTSCGLNEATWAPNFWLPYPRTAIRLLDYGYYSVDVDLGEMFLNFPLHESIQSSSGIDLSPFQKALGLGDGSKKLWYCWKRNWMGARMSPYSSVQFCSLAEEFCRGNNTDPSNPLRWDIIVLNLPGAPNYDPSRPRVYKWDKTMGALAGDLVIFVDDVRATAMTVELAWAIARQVCSRFQYLGVQDATRKRKPPTRTPGAWAGAVFATTDDTVTKTVTQEKWDKAKGIVTLLNEKISAGGQDPQLGYKELEVARGFLCHLSMTYDVLVPFLKGFHLALAGHLSKRDRDGWKLTDKVWAAYICDKIEQMSSKNEISLLGDSQTRGRLPDTPLFVKVTQHLRNDLRALAEFTEAATPPIINDRCATIRIVRYGFGDASGTGFGSTIQTSQGLKYRVGVWGTDEEDESSNFKELENVVTTIEEEALSGSLKDAALFFFTDNATVEAALFKGNTSSRKLFQLVVRFRKIQLVYGMQVSVSHVSGKRMISQGTDGVSRGNLKEGVGSGMEMIQFIPLHQGAIERNPNLLEWIKYWAGNDIELLSPSGWFKRGHDHVGGEVDKAGFWRIKTKPGIFIWAPPPAAAEAAIEQLRRALIKRQQSTHIIVCPRLLTTEWLKQLHKAADLVLSLPAGIDKKAWPAEMLEPLTIAFVFPFLRVNPWKRRSTPKMFDVVRQVSRMWKECDVDAGDFLRKFFADQLQLSSMPEHLVRQVLYFGK